MQKTIEKRDERLHMVATPEDIKLLDQLCQKEGMNRSEFVRHIIRSYPEFEEAVDITVKAQRMNFKLLGMVENLNKRIELKNQLIDVIVEELPEGQKIKNIDKINTIRRKLYELEVENG